MVRWGSNVGRIWLTSASFLFYFWLASACLPILIVSIFFNFSIGQILIVSKSHPNLGDYKRYIFFAGIAGNLGLLGYYKYLNFAILNIDTFFGLSIPAQEIILPLGISFFTFTQIAFLADSYHGKVNRLNLLSYAQFVTFFPHLIAGPIYHHADMIPQFEDRTRFALRWENVNLGGFFFFFGLAKKVLIADRLANVANPIFVAVGDGGIPMLLEAWLGAIAYTLQIYFDFSGYTEMAIGLGLLFNINLPLNFYSPYKTTSVIDFWRCWHITLSNWLRDYLYIPLGGNLGGLPAQIRTLMVTMLLAGLWHGAGWTFVIWGGLHGVYLVVNRLWRRTRVELPTYLCWVVTFVAVVIGWVFFRADSVASSVRMLKGMVGGYGVSIPLFLPDLGLFVHNGIINMAKIEEMKSSVIVLIALSIVLILPNLKDMTRVYRTALVTEKHDIVLINLLPLSINYRNSVRWSLITGLVAAAGIVSLQRTSEFLYFQF